MNYQSLHQTLKSGSSSTLVLRDIFLQRFSIVFSAYWLVTQQIQLMRTPFTVSISNKSSIWSGMKRDKNVITIWKKQFDVVGVSRTVIYINGSLLASNATQVCNVLVCTCRMALCIVIIRLQVLVALNAQMTCSLLWKGQNHSMPKAYRIC